MPLPSGKQQVLTISDFTPGIYSNGNYATNVPPAPLGAAQETNTYRCIGLPGGGLAPLPKRTSEYTIPWPGAGTTGTIVGLQVISGERTTNYVEIVHVLIDVDTSPRRVYWRAVESDTSTWTSIVWANTVITSGIDTTGDTFVTLSAAATQPLGCFSGYFSTVDPGDFNHNTMVRNVYFHVPNAAKVWAHGRDQVNFIAQMVASYSSIGGLTTVHQGRVLNNYGSPVSDLNASVSYRSSSGILAGFPFAYKVTTDTYDGSLNPSGAGFGETYGASGSISVGELLLIAQGGSESLTILGDIDQPTLIIQRGVQPTGNLLCHGVATPIGLLYPSEKNGVWVWDGKNNSQKISTQIRDNFFERTTSTSLNRKDTKVLIGESLIPSSWGKYALFPHNWLFDTETGSWWQIENTATKDLECWTAATPRYLWGTVNSIQSGTTNSLSRFDLDTPATSFSWQSQPISIAPYGSTVRVTDIEIKAVPSVADTNQTITVTLTNRDNTTTTETITINSKTTIPVRERVPTIMRGDDIIVRVQADGGANSAPVIHSVSLVWDTGTPIS